YVTQLVEGTPRERAAARRLLAKLVTLQRTDLLADVARRHADPRVRDAISRLLEPARDVGA
ncbi:MAG: hypothetical protein ACM368_10535, partial [Gemmatimonadota bacterium]